MSEILIVGNGNWATAIAILMAKNVKDRVLYILIHDEPLPSNTPNSLYEYILCHNENIKYLPKVKFPPNLKILADLKNIKALEILVFCVPHEFLPFYLEKVKNIKISKILNLCKGLFLHKKCLITPSEYITLKLGRPCSTLMGANIANEVSAEILTSTTIGFHTREEKKIYRKIFNNKNFKVSFLPYHFSIEFYGALKNVISLGYGIIKKMALQRKNIKSNTLAFYFERSIREVLKMVWYKDGEDHRSRKAFFYSCGLPDILVSCLSGRNSKAGEKIEEINRNKENLIKKVEEAFNGQKLQGPPTLEICYKFLKRNKILKKFKVIKALYKIIYKNKKTKLLIKALK